MKKLLEIPIAHRGLHGGEIPENSMAAFAAAAEAGFAIETDVHFTRDKTLAVFHDDSLLRMTGKECAIKDCALPELKSLRLSGTEEAIPTLEEALALIAGRVPLLLELKNEPTQKTEAFLEAVAAAFKGYPGEYAVQSFQPLYVRAYKLLRPEVPCGLLTDANPSQKDFTGPFGKIKRAVVAKMLLNFYVRPDFISFCHRTVTKKIVKFQGPKLAWTIRDPEEESSAREVADNIIFEKYIPKR